MGVWGTAPWESDDYGDLTDAIRAAFVTSVFPKIEAALKRAERGDTAEKWAAIGMVIVACQSTYLDEDRCHDLVQRANELWHQCDADKEWLRGYRNPRAFRKVFDDAADVLEDLNDRPRDPRLVELLFKGSKR